MVEVERFDVSKVPDHGRPRVVEFRSKAGTVSVHCERDTGALWLFASGPAGGDRGYVVVPVRMAEKLFEWLREKPSRGAPSTTGVLWLDAREDWPERRRWPEGAERVLVIAKSALHARRLEMPLDEAALATLVETFIDWTRGVALAGAS